MRTLRFRLGILALALAAAPAIYAAQAGITPPVQTVEVKPVYTPAAMRARIYGDVVVAFDVQTDGTTANFTIVKSLDTTYGLDQQAIEAVKRWRFKPATRDGVALTVRVNASLNFILRERDGTQLGASIAPVSAWPALFSSEIVEPGATWKPDTVKLGETTLRFEMPAGWIRQEARSSMLLKLVSGDSRRAVMTGPTMKVPGPLLLPMPPDRVAAFAKTMAAMPALQRAPLQAAGQVQIGARWWLWLETTPSADPSGQMPPEMRDALSAQNFSEIKTWVFVTTHESELVQILLSAWLPPAGAERDAEVRDATSIFRVILSKVSFSK